MNRPTKYQAPRWGDPAKLVTFAVSQPLKTHWVIVDCETAAGLGECPRYINGYVLEVPLHMIPEKQEAHFRAHRLSFTKVGSNDPKHVCYWFPPNQPCINSFRAPHRIRNDRPAGFASAAGDRRWIDRWTIQKMQPESWLDMFVSNQDSLAHKAQEG